MSTTLHPVVDIMSRTKQSNVSQLLQAIVTFLVATSNHTMAPISHLFVLWCGRALILGLQLAAHPLPCLDSSNDQSQGEASNIPCC